MAFKPDTHKCDPICTNIKTYPGCQKRRATTVLAKLPTCPKVELQSIYYQSPTKTNTKELQDVRLKLVN